MGGAMLRGWLANGLKPQNVTIIDPSPSAAMTEFLQEAGIATLPDASTANCVDVLLLAIKPQMFDAVLPGLTPLVGPDTTVVSVAAGKLISSMTDIFGDVSCIRTMPNTPSLVGRGMTVCCPNSVATKPQQQLVHVLLQAIGHVEWVEDEKLIDSVTAVSGSGPAYAFHLAECMTNAGIAAGLAPDLARTLATHTVAGAGELLITSDEDAGTLRENVTSPNGTTAAALEVLMAEDGMPQLVKRAVLAAKKRSEELS